METKPTCARCGMSYDYDAKSGGYDPISTWKSRGITEPMHMSCAAYELNHRVVAQIIATNTVDEYDRAREAKLTDRRS